MKGDGPSEIK